MLIHIKIVNRSKHALPAYATADACGMDLRANIEASVTLQPLQRALVGTGLYMALPKGYEAQVRPRSGLALKHGLTVLNSPGTVDADYRGEIKVMLINLSGEAFVLEDGERIAQLVVASHVQVTWQPVVAIDDTPRGQGGFGSTGIQ
jgi:dUTP pyrophosphatase